MIAVLATSARRIRSSPGAVCALGVLLLATAAGCRDIETTYGRSRSTSSVNGTSVLADMFKGAGHSVKVWPWLSPRLTNDADVIVWFPDDFKPPSTEVRVWLENWLLARPGRTLIYVGRDYDAEPDYWQKVRVGTTGDQQAEYNRRLAEARSGVALQRKSLTDDDGEWFKIDSKAPPRSVRTLSGDPEWLAGIDPSRVEIELHSRLLPAAGDEVLLESDGDALISRAEWGDSQLLIVANGSLFLNLKLINHEHRKLAGPLIDSVGSPPKSVYFLESRLPQLEIYEQDPQQGSTNALARILHPPLDQIVLQLGALGLLFAWSRLPIFGLPRKLEPPRLADFGQHVAALGELLEAARDEPYARQRLLSYHQTVRHDAPRGRLSAAPAQPSALGDAPAVENPPAAENPAAAERQTADSLAADANDQGAPPLPPSSTSSNP